MLSKYIFEYVGKTHVPNKDAFHQKKIANF